MLSGLVVLEDSLSRFFFFFSANVIATFNENLHSDEHGSNFYIYTILFNEHNNL